jgi:rhodanese-related sulfurtransferase
MRTWCPGLRDGQVPRVWLVLMTMFCGLFAAVGPLGAQQITKMDAPTAHEKALKGELLLVDIRTPEEWKETGVPTSAHAITMHQDGKVFLSSLLNAAGGSSKLPVALICRTGSRSTALAGPLVKAGFPNVINVVEGVVGGPRGTGWIKRGLPLRTWKPEEPGPQQAQQE